MSFRLLRLAWVAPAAVLLAGIGASQAAAGWSGSHGGSAFAGAGTLAAPGTPSASASGRNVSVSWSPVTTGGGPVSYEVARYTTGGTPQTVGSTCDGLVSGTSCTEKDVPPGNWVYRVNAVQGGWDGPQSGNSATVTVGSPQLSMDSPTTLSALPAAMTGTIANFLETQTVTYRLDDASTGTVLSGSIVPSPTPSNGGASVSVTIPAGVSNGSHTVYAIGSRGDVASAAITVAVPIPVKTTGWDFRDASSGTETNVTDAVSFADGRLRTTSSVPTAFSATRYLQFDLAPALDDTRAVSSPAFNFRFASNAAGRTSCFYFDVRRTSTGTVLATHGSTSSPVGCVTGTTQQTFTTNVPSVTTAAIADDLSIRVYLRNSAASAVRVDMGTLTGSTPQPLSFTLYESSLVDSTSGTAAAVPWPLWAGDGTNYRSAANWTTTLVTTRYLKLTFPADVPASSAVSAATFRHSYRSDTAGTTCWYMSLYSGATVIGTYGSATTPISCNSSTSTWVTDVVSLPQLDTAAEANSASVRIYVRNSSSRRSRHDEASLNFSYVP